MKVRKLRKPVKYWPRIVFPAPDGSWGAVHSIVMSGGILRWAPAPSFQDGPGKVSGTLEVHSPAVEILEEYLANKLTIELE